MFFFFPSGVRLGNIYCDPLMTSGHKITSRQRWTPTPVQLQILERIFDQGIGTPSKEKIKDITAELGQHGQISETNVYNWFQNRRARSKRKLQNVAAPSSNTESEVETEVDSKDKKTKPEEFQSQQNVTTATGVEKLCFQNIEKCSDLQYLNQDSNKSYSMFPSRNLSSTSVFDEVLSNSSMYNTFLPSLISSLAICFYELIWYIVHSEVEFCCVPILLDYRFQLNSSS